MTVARDTLVEYIQNPSTRSRLHTYMRRRGLADSADDLVQTVLCDALALTVEAVPVEPSELPRFVTGIARNKAADEHRRRARWNRKGDAEALEAVDSATTPDGAAGFTPCASPTHEARDLLQRIERDFNQPREREALSCLLREHAGESLYELARERALEPDTLRQRICRLRKELRARYLAPLALAVAFGVVGLNAWVRHVDTIALGVGSPLAAYAGEWRLTHVEPASYAAMHLRVRIDARAIHVYSAAEPLGRELYVERIDGKHIRLRCGDRHWDGTLRELSSRRIELRTARGAVVLER